MFFFRGLLDSLLHGKGLKSEELKLALLLRFQGVTQLVLTKEARVKADNQEKEKIKKESDIQIKDSSFVSFYDDNITFADDQQDPTYSPSTSSQALDAAFPCEKCGKQFKNQRSVEAHSKKHLKVEESKDQTFECTTCSKVFSNKYILATHIKSHNIGPETIERALCNVCSKSFANKYILKAHMQTHSEKTEATEVLSCDVCLKYFQNKYILKYHKKSHDADAKEKGTALCNFCSKLMAKSTLKIHMRHMHGEKKFSKCSNCLNNFRMYSIKSHERRCKRSDEERMARKVKCGQCGKALSGKANFRKHIINIYKMNITLKRYADFRKAFFSGNYKLRRHMRNIHNTEQHSK